MKQIEPSPAFRIATEVRVSLIEDTGQGVFALEPARSGTLLGLDFCNPENITPEAEVLDLPSNIRKYSWRHVEHLCFAADPERREATDLMNHSFEPNVHWHLGLYFAAIDIEVGDELLLDYRYLLSPLWNDRLRDSATGRPINGWEWRQSVLESCRKTIDILQRTTPKAD